MAHSGYFARAGLAPYWRRETVFRCGSRRRRPGPICLRRREVSHRSLLRRRAGDRSEHKRECRPEHPLRLYRPGSRLCLALLVIIPLPAPVHAFHHLWLANNYRGKYYPRSKPKRRVSSEIVLECFPRDLPEKTGRGRSSDLPLGMRRCYQVKGYGGESAHGILAIA